MAGRFRTWITVMALIALMGCASPNAVTESQSLAGNDDQGIAQPLIARASAHLKERLDIQDAKIAVQSVRPLAFPRSTRPSGEGPRKGDRESSGFLITLTAGDSAYEYHGRILGTVHILWHERESLSGSEK